MEEKEKNELIEDLKKIFGEKFSEIGGSITDLKSDIEKMKERPDPEKSKLENEQDKIKLDDISAKLDKLSDFFKPQEKNENEDEEKPVSFLSWLFDGGI